MPEAAVNEHRDARARKHDVGPTARKALMQTIPTRTAGEERTSEQQLRRGVGPPDTGHQARSGRAVEVVHSVLAFSSPFRLGGLTMELHQLLDNVPSYPGPSS
jgi:hypothetical protein